MAQDLTQWEYRRIMSTSTNKPDSELNQLGEQGWEAVGVDPNCKEIILKRPKQPQQQPSRPKDDDRYYGR